MVGGYVILTKKPLVLGVNDIGAMYGSIQNANKRFESLSSVQKPVVVEYKSPTGVNKVAIWMEAQSMTATAVTLVSINFNLIYNRDTGKATLAPKD